MCINKMNKVLFLTLAVKFCHGFLLENSNTSSVVKQAYLTIAEYYGDKSQLQNEIEAYHNQQVANRIQQERALKLLADQLEQRLLTMEQKTTKKIESHLQSSNLSEQKYNELETKYNAMKETNVKWEQKYQELEQNYTKLDQKLSIQKQVCLQNNTRQQNEIDKLKANGDLMENKTSVIQQELEQLKQLKSVNQLQTLTNIANKINTFESRISLLSGNEQSRNQDFLALYNLTTAASSRIKQMEAEHNRSILVLEQENKETRTNFTNRLDKLANLTDSKIDSLRQSQNLSLTHLQQTIEQNNKKVVLVACNQGPVYDYTVGSTYKFPKIVTKVGLPDLTTFTSTGKFVCPVDGIYYISAVLTGTEEFVFIDIMKNSTRMHRQLITDGDHGNSWEPGSANIALELKINDIVWIQTETVSNLYSSCLTIFKL